MVKKLIWLLMINVIVISVLSCQKSKAGVYRVENKHLLINEKIDIDLSQPIESVLKKLGNKYEQDSMPGYVGYSTKDYPLSFLVNDKTKKIDDILFVFYFNNEGDKPRRIDSVSILGFTLKKDTSFEDCQAILRENNIQYTIDERSVSFKLLCDDVGIEYMKDNLKGPKDIELLIK